MKINKNFLNLSESYLFYTIEKKSAQFISSNPDADIIKMGIGDVTLPICKAVTEEMVKAVEEQSQKSTFMGYGPYQGYDFLRSAIKDYYKQKNVDIHTDEIFISDGAKSDVANILDIFASGSTVLIPNPVYPVYLDTNIMAGNNVVYIDANQSNQFLPLPDNSVRADIIYICSPNNPTGAVYDYSGLEKWVKYALENEAVILFDAAYEAYISEDSLPTSIYQIEGAKECAIEFCSLSKTAGFTGTRCGYTIVPDNIKSEGVTLNKLWRRRQTTKFNGTAYVIQRGAAAVFSKQGQEQIKKDIAYYMDNAKMISRTLTELNIWHTGGKNSPYIWFKCPLGDSSWEFFDILLEKANVIGTPGSGFGTNGEGYFRMTGFASKERTIEACDRMKKLLGGR